MVERITAAHWRDRAEEARTQAAEMRDPRAKEDLLDIAENYDQLAEQAEARANSELIPSNGCGCQIALRGEPRSGLSKRVRRKGLNEGKR